MKDEGPRTAARHPFSSFIPTPCFEEKGEKGKREKGEKGKKESNSMPGPGIWASVAEWPSLG
jgi:hypothetical protein